MGVGWEGRDDVLATSSRRRTPQGMPTMAFGSEVKEKGCIQRRVMAGFIRVERRMARPRLDKSVEEVNMLPVLQGQFMPP